MIDDNVTSCAGVLTSVRTWTTNNDLRTIVENIKDICDYGVTLIRITSSFQTSNSWTYNIMTEVAESENLNDPRMPNQEKQYELQKATDPSLLKRQKEEAEKETHLIPFLLQGKSDLIQFAGGARRRTQSSNWTPVLRTLHPDFCPPL